MPSEYYILNESDKEELRKIRQEIINLRRNTRYGNTVSSLSSSSAIYIAKTRVGGIPALVGTTPGKADCDIYKLIPNGTDKTIVAVDTLFHTVYNLSSEAVAANAYIIIEQDRYGSWIAGSALTTAVVGSGSGTAVVGSGTGSGSAAYVDAGSTFYCSFARLKTTDCIRATLTNGGIVYLSYSAGHWVSTEPLTYLNTSGYLDFWFENGALHLKLSSLELINCGNGCFTGGPLTGHERVGSGSGSGSGSTPVTYCTGETFTICLACSCCTTTGFVGAGWYCLNFGIGTNPADCEPIYLTEDDRCLDVSICSGTYATYNEALIACGPAPVYTLSCYSVALPDRVKVTITSESTCAAFLAEHPSGLILVCDNTGAPDANHLWYIETSGVGWSITGWITCLSAAWAAGSDCNGPVSFLGGTNCEFGVAYHCGIYTNQTADSGAALLPLYAKLRLYGDTFVVVVEDYGPGPP